MVWPRRRRGVRKAPTRKNLRRAKRMITNLHKRKANKNMDTFFLKTKTTNIVAFSQGVGVSNYMYWNSSLDPTGVVGGASYLNNAEFNLYKVQYDKFRVNSVKVTVKPKANVFNATDAQNDGLYTLSGDGVIHTCIDRDGFAPSNIAAVSRYPSYRSYSALKTFSRMYSIKYPTGVWIDCQSPGTFTMAKELGLTGAITLYAENIVEDVGEVFNEPWAEILVEYNIVFQGKTNSSLSAVRDASGNLIGVTVNDNSTIVSLTPTVPLEVRGDL